MVRAKFKCTAIQLSAWSSDKILKTITLSPVTSNSIENKAFFEASPSGQIQLGILNESASKIFDLGIEYYIDFTPIIVDTGDAAKVES